MKAENLFCLPILFCLATSALAVPNPVLSLQNGNAADCGTMKFNGEYYLTGNYLAGDMIVSPDLVTWGNRTHVFSMSNDWAQGRAGRDREIHACDPNYYNGTFNLYWSVNRGDMGIVHIGHAVSDKVLGPYQEPERAHWFDSSIDAQLFRDDDGSFYFYSVKFNHGNQIWGQRMQNPSTLLGEPREMLSALPHTWELLDDSVNEGPYVFKYRDRYYHIYNANHTGKGNYALGCAEATTPLGFSNQGKYPDPVVEKSFPAPGHVLTQPGQPSVVRGPNGLEWWLVYFLEVDHARRQQAIDRVLFFDRHLYVDGPTSASPGYHPVPHQPAVLDLFDAPDGSVLANTWRVQGGQWSVKEKSARQTQPEGRALALLSQDKGARHYVAEASVRFLEGSGSEAGLMAYWQDPTHWLAISLDASNRTWNVRKADNQGESVVQRSLPKDFNFQAWHGLRAEKNGADFNVLIDDRPAPGLASPLATAFQEAGVPGLFSDGARAGFDGFLYTRGWDETGDSIRGWGNAANGDSQRGAWSITSKGLSQDKARGRSHIFKGDLGDQYEFSVQLTQDRPSISSGGHRVGMIPVYVDEQNYLQADVDLARWELRVGGRKEGTNLAVQTVSIPRRFPLPTSELKKQSWRMTFQAPAVNWFEESFQDSHWKKAAGPFGENGRTGWKTGDLWLRRHFVLDEVPTGMARLRLRLCGEAEVYINGVLAMNGVGQGQEYQSAEITEAAHQALKVGENTIAIHAHGPGADRAIDVGLFLPRLLETPGSVNLRAVKLKDRVILFVNGQQRMEVKGSWPASQVGLMTESAACHFSGITQFQFDPKTEVESK